MSPHQSVKVSPEKKCVHRCVKVFWGQKKSKGTQECATYEGEGMVGRAWQGGTHRCIDMVNVGST